MGILERWLEHRKKKQQAKDFATIEEHLSLAMGSLRKIRTDIEDKSNYYMLQDINRLLIDLQVYKRDIGMIPEERLMSEISRVRGGRFYANKTSLAAH